MTKYLTQQRAMRRMSPNNPPPPPVRRRLFGDEGPTDESSMDNVLNILRESHIRVNEEKRKKWNFDFENEVPLEGVYEWVKCDDGANDWVGLKPETKTEAKTATVVSKVQDSFLPMRLQNEMTPKSGVNRTEESSLLPRKRKKDDEHAGNDKGIRRKISFD